jgi:hypothetical protein
MIVPRRAFIAFAALLAAACVSSAHGAPQWSRDPAANTLVRDGASNSDQNQPKILPASDGGAYVVWLDGIGSGWDTRLQRLDARGSELWAEGGVLVSDTSFSSTEDYGFAVDASDSVFVAYRESGSPVTIEVQKIGPDGALLWSAAGVQVSTAASNAPRACATSDGGMIAAWSQSGVARVQKIDANGNVLWAAGGVSDTAALGTFAVSDVISDGAGGAIVLYLNSTGSFSAPRHLRAQRFASADGAKLWNGGSSIAVFDGGTLQIANFPPMIPDGAGGFVVAWYETGNQRNAWVQHVDVNGVEAFAHNGVAVADTAGSNIRIGAAAAYDASTGDTYLLAIEANGGQSQWHIIGQKINDEGTRDWGNTGIAFGPLAPQQPSFLQALPVAGAGAKAFWLENNNVQSARLNLKGGFAWTPGILAACSAGGGKARLSSSLNAAGTFAMLAWSDARNSIINPGERDIYAQNVNLDGSLGIPGDADGSGGVDADDIVAVILGWGACPPPPTFCDGDVDPAPRGNGSVDADDLVAVILKWG